MATAVQPHLPQPLAVQHNHWQYSTITGRLTRQSITAPGMLIHPAVRHWPLQGWCWAAATKHHPGIWCM